MKKMKKLASILLAAIMVLAMAVPAMAEAVQDETAPGDSKVTVSELEKHTFKAYKIFAGVANDEGMLGNITWAEGFDANGFISELKTAGILTDNDKEYTAIEVSEALAKCTADDSKKVAQFAVKHKGTEAGEPLIVTASGNVLKINETLSDGYYVIVDESVPTNSENYVFNRALLQVSGRGDIEIQVKTDKPTSQKKVKDINDSTGAGTSWQDSADYDIGDDVPFQLTGTLPNNVTEYEKYSLVFHDEQSEGLTFNEGSVAVYVNGEKKETGYSVKTSGLDDNCTFEVVIEDVVALGATNSDVITVEYTAKLNEDAKIGSDGNPNEMYMEYSNNPNVNGSGNTGTTPKDKVKVFTYKTVIDKVDDKNEPLKGAEFTLYKKIPQADADPRWEEQDVVTLEDGTEFEFKGLDDGQYKLVETKTPEGYNTVEDIYFEITAEHEDGDDPQLNNLTATEKDGEAYANSKDGGITFTPNTSEGSVKADVVNKSGAVLPETGGIGTTIFYVLGSILVVGAVILLVTKKRMSVEK